MIKYFKVGEKSYKFETGCNNPELRETRVCSGDCAECKHCTATIQGGDMAGIVNLLIDNGMAEVK